VSQFAQEELNIQHRKKLKRFETDFPYFAKHLLKIKSEQGNSLPFVMNQSQCILHEKIEQQLVETGKVRALILKGRKMGISTYIAGRLYHKCTMQHGKSVFVMAHKADSTSILFDMAKYFYDNIEEPCMKPDIKYSNVKKFSFEEIDGQYYVGTAGSGNVGRGSTPQYLHCSEVAFFENTEEVKTGIMQAVPKIRGTEIYLESTANGINNMFYDMCMAALDGKSNYQLIFLPWYWMDNYEFNKPFDNNLSLNHEEEEYIELFLKKYSREKQLRKIYWRRDTIAELGQWKFKQEFPATIQEAFVTSGDSLIKPKHIIKARNCTKKDRNAPMVIGVDPAREGDRTVIVFRRGREIPAYYVFDEMDEMQLSGILANFIDKHNPVLVNIDVGLGYGTVDRLLELNYRMVRGVHFGQQADESDIYRNKRAEMALALARWMEEDDINIPDDDAMHKDLTSVPDIKYASDGTIKLESKEKIKQTFGKSPDIFDACMLTFAFPVKRLEDRNTPKITGKGPSKASWKQIQKVG